MTAPRPPLTLGARTLRFDQPQIAGILNVTPDSFSDGGQLHDDPQAATAAGVDMTIA
ncbi:dihydropteroate synthase, partial [Acinetobacter baumannii]